MSAASEKPRRTRRRSGIRWWPLAVVLALAAGATAVLWSLDLGDRQKQVMATMAIALLSGLLALAWLLFLSRLPWRRRLIVFAAIVLLLLAFRSTFRLRGLSGDLVPLVEWGLTTQVPASADLARALDAGAGAVQSPHDYPQYLGPNRDATVAGPRLARDWRARPPEEIWRRPIGAGWSGFAIAGDYAVTQEQRDGEELVVAYDLATGEPRWTHADAARFEDSVSGAGPRATPTLVAGAAYTQGATGILNKLELATGRLIWSRDIGADNRARVPTYGFSASPLVVSGMVVVVAGGEGDRSLVAYDEESGEILWSGGGDGAAYSSPLLAEIAGTPQILLFGKRYLAGHDPASGRVLWRYPWPSGTERTSQPLPLTGDRIFLSSGYGIGAKLFQITRESAEELSVGLIWESLGLKAKFTNPVAKDGFLYGLDDGIMVCLDPADGSRRWKKGRYGHGQVILSNDLLLIQTEGGDVALVEPDPREHRELGRFEAVSGKTWATPALAGDRLVIRSDREAACYRLPTEASGEQAREPTPTGRSGEAGAPDLG